MLKYWLWLATRRGLGKNGALAVLRQFGTPEAAFYADEAAIRSLEFLKKPESLLDKDMREAEEILRLCYQKNIHILTFADAAYPERLRNIDDPPLLLYYQGVIPAIDTEPVIAMVGTRKASAYGLLQAKQLGYQLGKLGAVVVSGGAAGIDTLALKGALTAGRPVMAVLGCGCDVDYPRQNHDLFEDIRRHGCLLSEYPPETPPLPEHFPVRNRILSGIALGVLVVEAPKRSGALNTAHHAYNQGRDLFAVPGNVGIATCAGNLQLLKEGAGVVEEGWDVMKEYVHLYPELVSPQPKTVPMELNGDDLRTAEKPEKREPVVAENAEVPEKSDRKTVDKPKRKAYIDVQEILPKLSPDEKSIVELLADAPLHIDLIIDGTQLSAGRVLAAMTMLELKGYVRRLPGRVFGLAEQE